MQFSVPEIVAEYLAAEQANDAKRLSLCFTEDGVVHDEGQYHRGQDAIRRWKEEIDIKYKYVSEPLAASVSGNTVAVHAKLTGEFPGSPVELKQIFTLTGGKIHSMEVQS